MLSVVVTIAAGTDSFLGKLNSLPLLAADARFALPTEEQWEYACRAGSLTPFHFGLSLNGTQANCDGRLPYGTRVKGPFLGHAQPVGSYPPNAWGLYDMHGNLSEWCADGPSDKQSSTHKHERGGAWQFTASLCRSAAKEARRRTFGDRAQGFRLAIVGK